MNKLSCHNKFYKYYSWAQILSFLECETFLSAWGNYSQSDIFETISELRVFFFRFSLGFLEGEFPLLALIS